MKNKESAVGRLLVGFCAIMAPVVASALSPPPGPTSSWVCTAPPEPTQQQIQAWCAANPPGKRGNPAPANVRSPAQLNNLPARAAYNANLKSFLSSNAYSAPIAKGGWLRDPYWRFGGPVIGKVEGGTATDGGVTGGTLSVDGYFGTHQPMRIFYSPEVVAWMCGETETIADGAMLVKQQAGVGGIWNPTTGKSGWPLPVTLETGTQGGGNCMSIPQDNQYTGTNPNTGKTTTMTLKQMLAAQAWQVVMVRNNELSNDGWYWMEDISQNLTDKTAVTDTAIIQPENRRYIAPTGNVNYKPVPPPTKWESLGEAIAYPGSMYADYCVNCHGSAASENTFSSFVNLMGRDADYKLFPSSPVKAAAKQTMALAELVPSVSAVPMSAEGDVGAGHADPNAVAAMDADPTSREVDWHDFEFNAPLAKADPAFLKFFSQLEEVTEKMVWPMRMPAESYDHSFSSGENPGGFVTSDQCQGCHDASVSNSATPHMIFPDGKDAKGNDQFVNLSPYATWRASPMGMAGRDPIFFSQLRSELNFFAHASQQKGSQVPPTLHECLQNTCLHCHGAMGQHQLALDTEGSYKGDNCKDIFPIAPPPGVPFGKPFSIEDTTVWQGEGAHYAALARDGISCAVCHRIAAKDGDGQPYLGTESAFTGNWVADAPDRLNGPYKDDTVITKPMEHALGITPKFAEQVSDSKLCNSCHNVLLPIFNNNGSPNAEVASYEQTTGLEWENSVFSWPGKEFQSCQDCHMRTDYKGQELSSYIANIQSINDFAPQPGALPDDEIKLTKRGGADAKNGKFARHTLAGLNVFFNQFAEQFPALLGVRQIDYMNANADTVPAQIHGREIMIDIAQEASATVEIGKLTRDFGRQTLHGEATVTNLAGHFLPSGVAFRRVIMQIAAKDVHGNTLWCSGCTDDLGVILDGPNGKPLPSELVLKNPTAFQPHYEHVKRQDQAQIYQEVIADSAGHTTTSFMRRVKHLKDNRLRPKGYDPKFFTNYPSGSKYLKKLAVTNGRAALDPYYTNPKLTGQDKVEFTMRFAAGADLAKVNHVEVSLYNQSIPPFYLQQRFSQAKLSGGIPDEIQRLYFMASRLNTKRAADSAGNTFMKQWKLGLACAKRPLVASASTVCTPDNVQPLAASR